MSTVRADLRSYYEEEARLAARGPLRGRRLELRAQFVEQLVAEQRSSVIDFGAGPGRDAVGFHDAGISYVGLDLAHGNGVIAAQSDTIVMQASIDAPPLRQASFDAGWSMSTLMHVPDPDVPTALKALVAPLAPGAPMLFGLWGGTVGDHIDERGLDGQRRLFSLRSLDRNRELFKSIGHVEREELWDVGDRSGWEYQVFLMRISS